MIATPRSKRPEDEHLNSTAPSRLRADTNISRHQLENAFIRYALDSAAIVAHTDVRGTITYVNRKFCEISGYSESELIGSNHRMVRSGTHSGAYFRTMYRDIAQGRVWHGEICNRRKNGTLYWVDTTIVPHISEKGKVDSYTSIRFDISTRKQLEEDLRASEARLHRIANIDALTDLPNRRYFQEYLEKLVTDTSITGKRFHLGLLDIDSFKEINDSFGHNAGDLLLQTIGQRLSQVSDGKILIARLGGDEFGLIYISNDDEQADRFFEIILEAIRRPVSIGSTTRRCSASLGIATYARDADSTENLIKAADLALYHAKALGRDRLERFHDELREVVARKAAILEEIEDGLFRAEFDLHYQPIISTVDNGSFSFEALMRWNHPRHGLLTPGYFSEGFEDPAVRAAFGTFMLERLFMDMNTLRKSGLPLQRVSMNLTNSDFRSDVFIDRFFVLCEENAISPVKICVEVTEGIFLGRNQKRVSMGLQRLHAAGVEIALDDFGTGYASLTHLRTLPIDRLKIDRSFVANMVTSPEDCAIIRGVIDIAHSLGKVVTAEGVETREQAELLCQMGCDHLQGWYFSKAHSLASLLDMVKATSGFQDKIPKLVAS